MSHFKKTLALEQSYFVRILIGVAVGLPWECEPD